MFDICFFILDTNRIYNGSIFTIKLCIYFHSQYIKILRQLYTFEIYLAYLKKHVFDSPKVEINLKNRSMGKL